MVTDLSRQESMKTGWESKINYVHQHDLLFLRFSPVLLCYFSWYFLLNYCQFLEKIVVLMTAIIIWILEKRQLDYYIFHILKLLNRKVYKVGKITQFCIFFTKIIFIFLWLKKTKVFVLAVFSFIFIQLNNCSIN